MKKFEVWVVQGGPFAVVWLRGGEGMQHITHK